MPQLPRFARSPAELTEPEVREGVPPSLLQLEYEMARQGLTPGPVCRDWIYNPAEMEERGHHEESSFRGVSSSFLQEMADTVDNVTYRQGWSLCPSDQDCKPVCLQRK
mmetsp:Transcript_58412/g.79640  ORF Transcript_58412/g.79640 Transcript_58412/m.79640 type:complete len:108 (+) Transcript_58412:403-726(+)